MQIYGLIDPRDNKIHYVGKTNDANRRLIEHRNEHGRVNDEKTQWLSEIEAAGQKVSLTILETCEEGQAEARELYWIKQGRAQGWPLVNKAHGYETTARKLGALVDKSIRLGLLPDFANGLTDVQKRSILGQLTERAEQSLKASYDAMEAARQHAAEIEKLLEQIVEAAHETAPVE